MPSVKFTLGDELMKEALKIKNNLGLTWREATLQGLGMIIPPKQIGRPPQPRKQELTREKESKLEGLAERVLEIAKEAFYEAAVWRDFLPLIRVEYGQRYYKYDEREIKIPVISKTEEIGKNGEIDEQIVKEMALQVATEEGKLILVGEHEGWQALGIEGMIGTKGINIISSQGRWPENIFNDLINVRNQFKPKESLILVAPSKIINSLRQPIWTPPSDEGVPATYLNFLKEQKIVTDIYDTDTVFTLKGTQDTAMIFTPGRENAWMVEGMELVAFVWPDKNGIIYSTLRECITPVIANPSSIIQITDIVV